MVENIPSLPESSINSVNIQKKNGTKSQNSSERKQNLRNR